MGSSVLKAFCLSYFETVFPAVAGKGLRKKRNQKTKQQNNPSSVGSGKGVVLVAFLVALYRGCVGGKWAELSIRTIS